VLDQSGEYRLQGQAVERVIAGHECIRQKK